MIEIFRKKDFFAITVFYATLGMLVWYFTAKLGIFDKLGYQSDLYTHLEISRDWLLGRPLMYENCYGYHGKYHNYFFDLLMGPFTYYWGAYGLFIVQFLLYVWALLYAFPVIWKKATENDNRLAAAVFFIAGFMGPLSFWVYDNPHYGFHTEMLYVPLGLVLAIALYKKQTWMAVLSGLLMVAVKEDGPVMVACIHLLYFALLWIHQKITTKQWLLRSLVWGMVWVTVFVAGILYLKYQNDAGSDRLSQSFARIKNEPPAALREYFSTILLRWGRLLLPLLALLLYLRPKNYKGWLVWLVALVPITIVNFISGFVYFPEISFSLTWVPRFSLTLSLFLAMASFTLLLSGKKWFYPEFLNVLLAVVVGYGVFQWQKTAVQKSNTYSFRYSAIQVFKEAHPHTYYPHWNDVRNISLVLPRNYPVSMPNKLFGYFDKQDIIWTNYMFNAWQPPRMIICDETNRMHVTTLDMMQHPDSLVTDKLWIYFEKEDRHYLTEAGVKETQP